MLTMLDAHRFALCAHMWYIHMHTCGMSTYICMPTLHVNSKYPRELSNCSYEEFLVHEPFTQLQQAESRAQSAETWNYTSGNCNETCTKPLQISLPGFA